VAGEIRALAIDRGNGGVLVATANPNTLIRVDLTTLNATWTTPLPGTPVAVSALATAAIVAGGTDLWTVSPTAASAWSKARDAAMSLAASDEGSFLHVAEAGAIEVFDAQGQLQRTLELGTDRNPVALAAVPAGSSLYLGDGATHSAPPAAVVGTPGAIVTQKPPPTGTLADTARDVANYPPLQGAALVAVVILLGYWLIARWYDRRTRV
jgi:hypothetical protein